MAQQWYDSISKEKLDVFRREHERYPQPIDELLLTNQPTPFYFLDKDDIMSTARRHLNKPEVFQLLSLLRSLSDCEHLQKVGRQPDDFSRKLLRSLGYYREFEN